MTVAGITAILKEENVAELLGAQPHSDDDYQLMAEMIAGEMRKTWYGHLRRSEQNAYIQKLRRGELQREPAILPTEWTSTATVEGVARGVSFFANLDQNPFEQWDRDENARAVCLKAAERIMALA